PSGHRWSMRMRKLAVSNRSSEATAVVTRLRNSSAIFIVPNSSSEPKFFGFIIHWVVYLSLEWLSSRESSVSEDRELTQIKCYRGGELDWASDDTLTQVRGYPSPEHE